MATEETIRRSGYRRRYHEQNRARNNKRSLDWYYENREDVLAAHKVRMRSDQMSTDETPTEILFERWKN